MAWATEGTRPAKSVISQFRSWTGDVSGLTIPLSARPREASWMAAALRGAARCYEAQGQEARGREARGQEARCSEAPVHQGPGHGGQGHQGRGYEARSASSPMGVSSSGPLARAFLIPCWKLDSRCLVCEADRPGTGGACATGPAPPGTRFALGTRLGSPAPVVSANTGARTASAACHPASAGDDQPVSATSGGESGRLTGWPPRRNQSDSTDSKMGRRFSVPVLSAGGRITWRVSGTGPGEPAPGPAMPVPIPVTIPFADTRGTGDGAGTSVLASGRAPVSAAASPWPGWPGWPSGPRRPAAGRAGRLSAAGHVIVGWSSSPLTARPVSIQEVAPAVLGSPSGRRSTRDAAAVCVITSSGSHTSAVRPPLDAGRSRTWIPCLAASRATTNRPIRRDTATSTTGGLSSRQLAWAISSAPIPTPWSVMSSSTPPLLSESPDTWPRDSAEENAVAFSASSESR